MSLNERFVAVLREVVAEPVADVTANRLLALLLHEQRVNAMSSAGQTIDMKTRKIVSHSDFRYDHRYVSVWEPCSVEGNYRE